MFNPLLCGIWLFVRVTRRATPQPCKSRTLCIKAQCGLGHGLSVGCNNGCDRFAAVGPKARQSATLTRPDRSSITETQKSGLCLEQGSLFRLHFTRINNLTRITRRKETSTFQLASACDLAVRSSCSILSITLLVNALNIVDDLSFYNYLSNVHVFGYSQLVIT